MNATRRRAPRRPAPENPLPRLFHYRWAVPTLAALGELGGGSKFVTLQNKLGVSRDSLRRTLTALIDAGLAVRNPGYGHPLRPEYLLTATGRELAEPCGALVATLRRLEIEDVALRKWSIPLAHALATAGGRFNHVLHALGDVTPRALAQALRDLQDAGLVERRLIDDNPPRAEYELTPRGRRLTPVMLALARAT